MRVAHNLLRGAAAKHTLKARPAMGCEDDEVNVKVPRGFGDHRVRHADA